MKTLNITLNLYVVTTSSHNLAISIKVTCWKGFQKQLIDVIVMAAMSQKNWQVLFFENEMFWWVWCQARQNIVMHDGLLPTLLPRQRFQKVKIAPMSLLKSNLILPSVYYLPFTFPYKESRVSVSAAYTFYNFNPINHKNKLCFSWYAHILQYLI